MSEKPDREIVIIRESPLKSWARDLSSFVMAILMIGAGKVVGLPPLEYVGAFLFVMGLFMHSSGWSKTHTFTPQAAADKLKAEYGVTASE